MKLVRFGPAGREKPGALDEQGVVRDLSGVVPDLGGAVLSRAGRERLAALDLKTLPPASEGARIGPCVGQIGKFICVGLNYADHAAEAGVQAPSEPILFMKATTAVCGPYDPVLMPPDATKLDWEVELAIVIGDGGVRLSEVDADAAIAGWCVCNDVSERAFQLERGGQWVKGKSCDTFGPLGPWLVTKEEMPSVDDLGLWLDVNDARMQTGSTREMIFKPTFLVSYISRFMRLEPGDVISTGTPPGVGMGKVPPRFLAVGDSMSLGIDGLGAQRQSVVAAE